MSAPLSLWARHGHLIPASQPEKGNWPIIGQITLSKFLLHLISVTRCRGEKCKGCVMAIRNVATSTTGISTSGWPWRTQSVGRRIWPNEVDWNFWHATSHRGTSRMQKLESCRGLNPIDWWPHGIEIKRVSWTDQPNAGLSVLKAGFCGKCSSTAYITHFTLTSLLSQVHTEQMCP